MDTLARKATVLLKQLCYIQTKMYSLYRKMTILGSIIEPCYIPNEQSYKAGCVYHNLPYNIYGNERHRFVNIMRSKETW